MTRRINRVRVSRIDTHAPEKLKHRGLIDAFIGVKAGCDERAGLKTPGSMGKLDLASSGFFATGPIKDRMDEQCLMISNS